MSGFLGKLPSFDELSEGDSRKRAVVLGMQMVNAMLETEILELWSNDGGDLRCWQVVHSANKDISNPYRLFSPQVCLGASQSLIRLKWRTVAESDLSLYNNGETIKFEFSFRVDNYFSRKNVILIGYSSKLVNIKSNLDQFLCGVGHSICITIFGFEDKDVISVNGSEAGSINRSPSVSDRGSVLLHSNTEIMSISFSRNNSFDKKVPMTHLEPDELNALYRYDLSSLPSKTEKVTLKSADDIVIQNKVAEGSNSFICKGLFNNKKVAIKMMMKVAAGDTLAQREYASELEILHKMDHPYIIKIFGYGDSPRPFLILEWLSGHSLRHILENNRRNTGIRLLHKSTFSYRSLLQTARKIASAVHYLHRQCHPDVIIIHRDLKPDNIVFSDEGSPKLIDFGLCTGIRSSHSPTDTYVLTGGTGSRRYMAPEVALRQNYNEKVDVYSFGIILWEMAKDKVPFSGIPPVEFLERVVKRGERPKIDPKWPANFCSLLTTCWAVNSQSRPSFRRIIEILEGLIISHGHAPEILPYVHPSPPDEEIIHE